MSSTEDSSLKAGHPPAVKAGGMRITQHKPPKSDKADKEPSPEDLDSVNSLTPSSSSPPKTTMVSGAPVRGNADFPTEAVQHFHNKPLPTHDARSTHDKPNFIQQPRK